MAERKSGRQEYILRVRYQNTLPPPPFEPKFLKLPDFSSKYTSATFMSTLVQEQQPTMEIDAELGMPLDLSRVPGVFEGDDSLLYAPEVPQQLDPRDKRLMKGVDGQTVVGAPTKDVSYLRRTQYISSELSLSTGKQQQRQREAAKRQRDHEAEQRRLELEPGRQLAAVDETFKAANAPLHTLVHPGKDKRHLKAITSYSVLPDTYFSALDFVNLKFTADPAPRGSAGERPTEVEPKLESALLVPNASDELGEFLTYFLPKETSAAEAICASNAAAADRRAAHSAGGEHLDEATDSALPQDMSFRFERDYDMTRNAVADDYAIVFTSTGIARYVQLESRMTMRSRRLTATPGKAAGRDGISKRREMYKVGLRAIGPEEREDLHMRQNRYGTPDQHRRYKEYMLELARAQQAAAEAAEEADEDKEPRATGASTVRALQDLADDNDDDDDDDDDLPSLDLNATSGGRAPTIGADGDDDMLDD